jgi:hypothetical protein
MSEQPDHPELIAPESHTRPSRKLAADLAAGDAADLFTEACRTFGERPAYKIGSTWLSYSDCATRVHGIAASLCETLQRHVAKTRKQAVIVSNVS